MKVNLEALRVRKSDNNYLQRYNEIANLLLDTSSAVAEDGVKWVLDLCHKFNIQSLSSLGLVEEDLPEVIKKGEYSSSMQGNPTKLTHDEMENILTHAL